ncbi:E3 ubiquitin-protein ligase TRIM23-like isoform X1 [Oratosquilla oratoria]|uniref:E3 ubiquitin-protein ligase TRIM23-like isoform X1 n=1 Tax=Oratosquilla oratoria TaxID=337810 RepID=UPI003F76AB0B
MELMKKLIRKCPKCGTSYKLKEGKDLGYQYPVVLNCGHSACRGCVCSNSEYTCTHCQEVSIVKNVNIHTCVISWSSKNWMTLSKNGLQMTLEPLKSHSISSEEVDGNKGSCDECCIATAEVQCKICKIQVCQPCFQNIHSARTLSKHKAEPLYSFKFAMDVCSSHDVVCDHVCLTCSQSVDAGVFVCTECCVFGQHKKHQVMTLEEMNAGIAPQLKFVLEDAEMLNQRLQRLVKVCSSTLTSSILRGTHFVLVNTM